MFRVVSLPIIRRKHNCIYSIWYLLTVNLLLLWESWSWPECGVGILTIEAGSNNG